MSESSFPFPGQTMTQAPVPDISPSGGGNRSKLLALGGVAVVLVLALVAYFLVFAGNDEDDGGSATAPKPAVAAPDQAAQPPAATKPAKKERISAKSFGRDPFKPLIVEAVAAPAAVAPAAGTSTGATRTGGTVNGASTPVVSTAHKFRVVDVAPDNSSITVKVDGKLYRNLKAGEVFATYFKVRFIGGSVNDFQYGDDNFKVVGDDPVQLA